MAETVYSSYRVAKAEAGRIAGELGMPLLQTPTGKPRIITPTGCRKDFGTWLAAWSWLSQVQADMAKKSG